MEDMPVSSRKYPYIMFKPERPCGDIILEINSLYQENGRCEHAGQF